MWKRTKNEKGQTKNAREQRKEVKTHKQLLVAVTGTKFEESWLNC